MSLSGLEEAIKSNAPMELCVLKGGKSEDEVEEV